MLNTEQSKRNLISLCNVISVIICKQIVYRIFIYFCDLGVYKQYITKAFKSNDNYITKMQIVTCRWSTGDDNNGL
jgi:hypothetical protein